MLDISSASLGGQAGAGQSNLKCFIMVAKRHLIDLTLPGVLADNGLADGPVSTRTLLRCATKAGLRAKTVKLRGLSGARLRRALPLIVTLKSGASMVMVDCSDGPELPSVRLLDPDAEEIGPLTLDRARFDEACTGEAIEIRRVYPLSDEEQPLGWRFVAGLILRERGLVRYLVTSAVILSVIALAPIMFFRLLSDRVMYNAGSATSMNTYVALCLGMAVIVLFETVFGYLRTVFATIITTRVQSRIMEYMFARTLRLPIDFFERTQSGYITATLEQVGAVREFIETQLFGSILDSLTLFIFLPVMFLFNPIMTCVVLFFCALVMVWLIFTLPAARRVTGAVIGAEVARGSFLYQNLQGMRTVKSLALETRQRWQWDLFVSKVIKLKLDQGFTLSRIQAVVTPLERLAVVGAICVGVYIALVGHDPVLIGSLFAYYMLSARCVAPLAQMAKLVTTFDEARSKLAQGAGLVNQPGEVAVGGIKSPMYGHIEFRRLSFRYQGSPNYALDNVSFEIPIGRTLGVVGRSGSGKTTLTRLLQHLHAVYEGEILIDGVEVRDYDVAHLRRSLGVVLQENYLFSGSIRDNITAAKPHATFEEIVRVARLSGAEEFIDRLPRGYETHIFEGSPNLSGGQRQRLAIARALLLDPKILILDEATSALDPDSEAIVNENIARIAEGRTVIVISHRLASLVNSDAILVLERGKFVDMGKHYELMERCEIYSGLWNQQNRHIAAASRPAAARGPARVS